MAGPSKDELRAALRARRRGLTDQERIAADLSITTSVVQDDSVVAAKCIHIYLSTKFEVSTTVIIRTLIDRGVMVAVPWMESDGSMGATALLAEDIPKIVEAGLRGIPSAPVWREADLASVDVVVVPLVGADSRGHRLGMGAGHYDRFLAAYPNVTTIGLAFSCQIVDEIPTEPHDIPLTRIITVTC